MTDLPDSSLDTEAPPPAAPPGPIVQSAAIGFRVVFIATLLLGGIWLFSNCRVINPESQAVVLRFGQVVKTQPSGFLLAWPRPIDQVQMLPGPERRLTRQVGPLLKMAGINEASNDPTARPLPDTATPYLTGDNNVVLLDATLNYRISDPVAYVLRQEHLSPALDRMFRATAVQVAAGQAVNDFMVAQGSSASRSGLGISTVREAVRQRLTDGVNARLKDLDAHKVGFGVEVVRIDLTPQLPPVAKLAYDQVLQATQKAEQNRATAQIDAENLRQGADQQAVRIKADAQNIATQRTTQATLDTTSILAYERAAGSARSGLEQQYYRDNIGTVLGKAGSVLVVDPQSGQRIVTNGPGARPK